MARLGGFARAVTSVVPAGFEAYVRIFHPAGRMVDGTMVPVRWAEVAAAHGTVAHPSMQWPGVTGGEPRGWDVAPPEGQLPPGLASALAAVLRPWTATPERCWFAVWEGWGGLPEAVRRAPAFEIPGRRLHVVPGAVEAAAASFLPPPCYQPANLWWPDDRAWCVATEIDFESTYVGGSRGCVDAVLADPAFEAFEVQPGDGVTWASDIMNPP